MINTHWHGDHTSGNLAFVKDGAVIIAHDNTREKMSKPQISLSGEMTKPAPQQALPTLTFSDKFTLHDAQEPILLEYIPNAHSQSDVLVYLPKSNVIHMGDILFNEHYPYIDVNAGGSINGMIEGVERGITLANEQTKIIAGHGKNTNQAGLKEYLKMLVSVRDAVQKAQGKTLAQIQASKPTAQWDSVYTNQLISPERFVESVFNSLLSAQK